MKSPVALSVVLPCLNEKSSLETVITEIKKTCEPLDLAYEIIVADNGSTDGSREEAARLGARVVPVETRGYGNAVNGGILAAQGEIVVFGDADGSYPFCEIPRLIEPIQKGEADLVVGNRLSKKLSKEAMPWIHRYFGTPALSFLLRFLHGIDVFDCNGGLRALRREKYEELQLKQPGMEYASEMLIRAAQQNWNYREISIELRPAHQKHVPHLRTWRDGCRHVWTMIKHCCLVKNFWTNVGLLLLCMVACGVYGLTLGKDADWDLLNYHLYNPYALFTGRFGVDVIPAGIHTFFNPLLDVPLYLGIKYLNNYPRLLVFLWSMPGGIFVFFTYRLARLFFPVKKEILFAILVVVVGCSGSMFLSQVGMSTAEVWAVSLLTISAYLFFRWLKEDRKITMLAFACALIAGATTGMKMTAAPFVVGLTVVFIANLRGSWRPWRQFAWFAFGGVLGFLITNGYFMMRLWVLYQNPVFPFFNEFFKSPFFAPENWKDLRFFPKTTLQWIFYPFYWMNQEARLTTEIETLDPRLALGYVSVLGVGIVALFKKWRGAGNRMIYSLAVLSAITYICWLQVYSILRYVIILEAFSALLAIWLLKKFLRPLYALLVGALVGLIFVNVTVIPDWGHEPFDSYEYVHFTPWFPKVEPGALVVFFGHPMTFAAPFFPADTRFVGGVTFEVEKYPPQHQRKARQRRGLPESYYQYRFDPQIKEAISQHSGPIYIMAVPWEMMLHPITLARYGLQATTEECQFFNTNINKYSRGWDLCKVQKLDL